MTRAPLRGWLVAALLGLAGPAGAVEPEKPDWSDAEQRTDAQLRVIGGLIDADLADDALRNISRLREAGEDDPRFEALKARALHVKGLDSEARAILETYLRKNRRDGQAWALLGVLRADVKDLEGSRAALDRARRLLPNDPNVLNNLGWVLLARGEAEEAVRLFRASLAVDPVQVRVRNNLGFALARLERDDEALEAFRSTAPEADARYNLGLACEMRSDRTSAITHYQAALRSRPDHPGAGPALARMLSEGSP